MGNTSSSTYLLLQNRTNSFLKSLNMPTFRQGDWAKAESHQSLSPRVRLDQELGVAGLYYLMPQWGSCPTTHFPWFLEGRISCLHRPEMSLIHYPEKWGKKESSGSWNPIRGCRPILGGRGSLGVPLHGEKSDWAPASLSSQYSSLQILKLWSRGAIAYVKSCFVPTASSESAQMGFWFPHVHSTRWFPISQVGGEAETESLRIPHLGENPWIYSLGQPKER